MTQQDTPAELIDWLLRSVEKKRIDLSDKLQYDPKPFLHGSTSAQAALCRQVYGMVALPTDSEALDKLASDLVAHIVEHREPSNDAFQKGYAEVMLRQNPNLQEATNTLIEEEWQTEQKIGHYELFSALVLTYPEEKVIRKTLAEIHGLLQTWGNEGWCPWTPALWMRILWLGEELSDASTDITAQLEYIDSRLSEDGRFQYREPFCLMYSIGLMDHPLGDKMLDRFLRVIITEQQLDGGWGDYSYIAFTLLKKWDLLEALAP